MVYLSGLLRIAPDSVPACGATAKRQARCLPKLEAKGKLMPGQGKACLQAGNLAR